MQSLMMEGELNIRQGIIGLSLLWLVVIAASFWGNYSGTIREQRNLALFTARSFFQQVVISRQWNARHGGVYVPVTPSTRPNPYLTAPDRDLVIGEDTVLTKINPAFMTRQIAEIAQEGQGVQFHITSLNPLRPENKATPLEASYLEQFEDGLREGGEMMSRGGRSDFFYMAPLFTEQACLPCHAGQGYRLGDVRGGISITLPFQAETSVTMMIVTHLGMGLLGLVGLGLVGRKLSASYQTIRQQAIMDALTGIPNRRSFSERILMAFDRCCRENEPLSLIMCDIDNFKRYNDTYGHGAGDLCIQQVAQSLQAALKRSGDFCARYGGEEFVVVLVDTEQAGAMTVAERIRSSIEQLQIPHEGVAVGKVVTISLGLATHRDSSARSHEELIRQADQALYRAKALGRNQVQPYQRPAI
ncbi:diguanylate cyclase [Desulfogranum mediterraneum]|uniref:diguanylate cyclase n=1 Tax=Desulfogranum mediterraneum TaxID=160661 RepID=UPI000415E039|nr:diguanylate cyclase [Desulfogranum mediterraneum]